MLRTAAGVGGDSTGAGAGAADDLGAGGGDCVAHPTRAAPNNNVNTYVLIRMTPPEYADY